MLYAGASAFDYREPTEAALYHLLNRGHLALQQGLWLPLIGFPLAAAVVGFLLPLRAAWPRVAATVLGVAATAWMVVWRSDALQWVLVPAGYVALCVLLLWTPGVTRWLRTRPRTQETPR
ncbi:hypothetical protein GC722_04850 [Auraticoccus sp. F435]|uniref:Uncharacterized protein n=1 Tax=Auraticoccus cholistanensis TaxID=2656650 RepID=A0A6A9V0G1_9ACTN|nr:hypothetical protein [Auraticoccus cholistanensis]MVA75360.1 hypothetical protein [Auraticoccus cholistanensis]